MLHARNAVLRSKGSVHSLTSGKLTAGQPKKVLLRNPHAAERSVSAENGAANDDRSLSRFYGTMTERINAVRRVFSTDKSAVNDDNSLSSFNTFMTYNTLAENRINDILSADNHAENDRTSTDGLHWGISEKIFAANSMLADRSFSDSTVLYPLREYRTEFVPTGEMAYNGTMETLSLLEKPSSSPQPEQKTAPPMTAAPSSDDMIRKYGNLIAGADATGRTVSFNAKSSGDIMREIKVLEGRLNESAKKAELQAAQLDELKKKQKEIESKALKSTDIKVLSDEVMTRLRTQLRMEKARYSNR